MGKNQLFQKARELTTELETKSELSIPITEDDLNRAKNALSSAYANSTFAEQKQLQQFQKKLDDIQAE